MSVAFKSKAKKNTYLTFTVTTLDKASGSVGDEIVHADTADLARAQVARPELTVLGVRQHGTGINRDIEMFAPPVKTSDLATMARLLATMINSGLTLMRAISILVGQTENPTLRKALRSVESDLESGSPFSEALAKHERVFPPLMVSLIKAAEVGGFLDTALLQLAESMEKQVKLRNDIKSAMTYPVIVLCMAVLGVIGMLLTIVPSMSKTFAGLGGELPFMTQVLVDGAAFMKVAIIPLIIALVVFVFWWRRAKNTEKVRAFIDPLKLKMPVFGTLNLHIALGRFTRNLAIMLGNGVTIIQALDVVGDTANSVVIRAAMQDAAKHIKEGAKFNEHLGDSGAIPDLVVQMIAVGEETGNTDQMLRSLADFYDQDVEARAAQLSSTLEPIMIAVLGVVLGGMVIALYMPTFQVFDLIQ